MRFGSGSVSSCGLFKVWVLMLRTPRWPSTLSVWGSRDSSIPKPSFAIGISMCAAVTQRNCDSIYLSRKPCRRWPRGYLDPDARRGSSDIGRVLSHCMSHAQASGGESPGSRHRMPVSRSRSRFSQPAVGCDPAFCLGQFPGSCPWHDGMTEPHQAILRILASISRSQ
jgi:hypothetical protein